MRVQILLLSILIVLLVGCATKPAPVPVFQKYERCERPTRPQISERPAGHLGSKAVGSWLMRSIDDLSSYAIRLEGAVDCYEKQSQ